MRYPFNARWIWASLLLAMISAVLAPAWFSMTFLGLILIVTLVALWTRSRS